MRPREQVDQIEVGSMCERLAAQPAEAQDDELGPGHAAVRLLEFGDRGIDEDVDRRLGHMRVAGRDL